MTYIVQFYRQWLGDSRIDDVPAEGALEEVKALAREMLADHGRDRESRRRPRTARIVDAGSREILAAYRLTERGPAEVPLAPKT